MVPGTLLTDWKQQASFTANAWVDRKVSKEMMHATLMEKKKTDGKNKWQYTAGADDEWNTDVGKIWADSIKVRYISAQATKFQKTESGAHPGHVWLI